MASTRRKETKDGRAYYEIRCRVSRDRPELSTRWYVPEGWSKRAIERELAKQSAEFERKCQAGEVLSRSETKEKEAQEARERASILTVKDYAEQVFMPEKTIRCAENTRAFYQNQLDKHIFPAIGDFRLPEVTPAQLKALLLTMQKGKYSHSTNIAVYTTLHQIFKSAYMADLIERNPMDKVERPRQGKEKIRSNEVEAYTAGELSHMIDCLEKEPLKWRALVRLLIDTGCRRGEACGLQWKDIDFQKGQITIANNLLYTKEKGVYMTTPKSGKARTVDVAPEVLNLLRELRWEQAQSAISPFVFTQDESPEPMFPQSPTRYLQKFAKRYGISDLHPHKLRHSFASVAITNGADIASVSEKLGHANKGITLKMYTHADQESIKRAGDIFRQALEKKA